MIVVAPWTRTEAGAASPKEEQCRCEQAEEGSAKSACSCVLLCAKSGGGDGVDGGEGVLAGSGQSDAGGEQRAGGERGWSDGAAVEYDRSGEVVLGCESKGVGGGVTAENSDCGGWGTVDGEAEVSVGKAGSGERDDVG